jgi:hypothetical protein
MNLDSSRFVQGERSVARYMELKKRPPPVRVPRKRMELQFAVQLMRCSYNAMDSLDFTPTDLFQRNQFLFRQSEWELYRKDHSNVMQGDLASPDYFDFISFVQFNTLDFCMNEASNEPFIEVVGADAVSQKVVPLPMLDSKAKIAAVHAAITGDGVLDYILSTYPSSILPSNVPLSGSSLTIPGGTVVEREVVSVAAASDTDRNGSGRSKGRIAEFVEAANLILDIFAINSFCLLPRLTVPSMGASSNNGNNNENSDGGVLNLMQTLPANLWSLQTLRRSQRVRVLLYYCSSFLPSLLHFLFVMVILS